MVLMGGIVKFSAYLTGGHPQAKGTAKSKAYSSCPGATGFVTQSTGVIKIGYHPNFKLFVQLFNNSGTGTEWYFKHSYNHSPLNPFEKRVLIGKISNNIDNSENYNWHSSIAGVWNTNFGKMIIRQKRVEIYGEYKYDRGIIEGLLNGRILKGKWSEAPTYKQPKDAGEFEFIFAPDGKSFKGKWRYGFGGTKWNRQ